MTKRCSALVRTIYIHILHTSLTSGKKFIINGTLSVLVLLHSFIPPAVVVKQPPPPHPTTHPPIDINAIQFPTSICLEEEGKWRSGFMLSGRGGFFFFPGS
jgi:hypothetical protein